MRCYVFKAVLFFAVSGIAIGGCAQTFKAAPDARNVSPADAYAGTAPGKGRAAAGTGSPVIRAAPRTSPGTASGNAHGRGAGGAARALDAAVAPLAREDGGHVAVAVQNLVTGKRASYSGTGEYAAASIEKADILAARLYQEQREGESGLSRDERQLADAMITRSDNDAASALWRDAGGPAGVDAANRAFGLRETAAGNGPYWGLTETTADDQLRLLRQLMAGGPVLKAAAQGYERDLMSDVEPSQAWGVSAAADPGTPVALKNGWLPNPGLWVINSIGAVTHRGQRMLVAVLSDDNPTEGSGIGLVEQVARKAADAMASSR